MKLNIIKIWCIVNAILLSLPLMADNYVVNMKVGEQRTFTCSASTSSNIENYTVKSWSWSLGQGTDPSCLTIISKNARSCKVRAEKAGNIALEYYIKFESSDWYYSTWETKDTYIIYIEGGVPVTSVTVSPTKLQMEPGEEKDLSVTVSPSNATDKSVTWSSSNASVATVNSSGHVKAKAAGNTTITCKANDGSGKQGTCSVTVTAADPIKVTGITLNYTSASMVVGDTKQLSATISPSNATDKSVTWTSSNTSVADVSSNGLVTAKAEGNCTITCKANDGSAKQATCSIIVKKATPTGVFTEKTIEGVEMTFYGSSDGTCRVYSIDKQTTGKVTIPSEAGGLKVIEIGSGAFKDCKGVTEVVIPTSIKTIRSYAFSSCSSITSINLRNSVERLDFSAFRDCTSLTAINGFNNLEYVDTYVFYRTPWEANLPDGQIYLGKVFYKYKGTMPEDTSFTFKNGTKCIVGNAFDNCKGLVSIAIPGTVDSVDGSAFARCDNLSTITVESGNTTYDSRNNCNAVIETSTNTLVAGCKATTIPSSAKAIGDDAFYQNYALESIAIPNNIESIGSLAFSDCKALSTVVVGRGLKKIGYDYNFSFIGCTSLKSINVVSDNPYFDSRDNCNAIIETATNRLIVGCSATVIPNSVKTIGEFAYYGNGPIENIFIPNSVEKIESSAFSLLSSLKTVVIGSGVKEFGREIFFSCNKLSSIISYIDFPSDINEDNFPERIYSDATLYVSMGSKFNYMSCIGWGKFKNIVEFDPSTFDPSTLSIHGVTMDADKDAPIFDLFGRKLAQPKKGINIINGRKVIVK